MQFFHKFLLTDGAFGLTIEKETEKKGVPMKQIHVVLHCPEIPQNTGNIARTCAAPGARLHLIKPLGFEIDDKKMKRAGLDYWDKLGVTFYENEDDFFKKNAGKTIYYFSTKAPRAYTEVAFEDEVYLMFGRETRGLPESLLERNPDTTVRIPMLPTLRSLNLSNSVAIAVYEVLRQDGFDGLSEIGVPTSFVWGEGQV